MQRFSLTDKINVGASKLRIIGLLFMVVAFGLFIYLTNRQGTNIEIQEKEIIERDHVIAQRDAVLADLSVEQIREQRLVSTVDEFVRLRAEHNVDALDGLFADRVDRYFVNVTNSSKEEIRRLDTLYWRRFPKDRFVPIGNPEIIINKDDTAKAIIKGDQCRDGERCVVQLLEIIFDSDNKIKAVRGFNAP